MKKILSIIMAIAGLCLVACTEDPDSPGTAYYEGPDVDFSIKIDIQDSEGHSLLDPNADNNIIGSDVYLDYNGKSYNTYWEWDKEWDPTISATRDSAHCNLPDPIIRSRVTNPQFQGIIHLLGGQPNTDPVIYKWEIYIGQFSGSTAEREMNLLVGDKSYDIKLVTVVEGAITDRVKHVEKTVYLDGEVVKGPYVVIKI